METCGCGGIVERDDGPTHPYMQSAAGCWRLYGELTDRTIQLGPDVFLSSHVDCFAAQHTGGADNDRRQRSSTAVHLIALCLRLEHRMTPGKLIRIRQRTSAVVLPVLGIEDWPLLTSPATFGDVTVASLHGRADHDLARALGEWAPSVWNAWNAQHTTIQRWVQILLTAGVAAR